MKTLFASLFVIMVIASVGTVLTLPDAQTDVPVIYWVTAPNPARIEQIELFHEWLVHNGHTTEDAKPCVELRLDTATTVNVVPLIILFIVLQKYLVRGIHLGAVKG